MRFWGVWNLLFDLVFWVACIVGLIVLAGVAWYIIPRFWVVLFIFAIGIGAVIAIQGIREEARRSGDTEVNG